MKKTQFIKGIGVTPGIIIGKAYLLDRGKIEAPARVIPESHTPQEVARFRDAVEESKKQLDHAIEILTRLGAKRDLEKARSAFASK